MSKILITGGAGYLGSILVPDLLNANHQITVLDNLMYNQNSLSQNFNNHNFNFIREDICNHKNITKILGDFEIIIPLACIVGAPACDKNPILSKLINYDAHVNILKSVNKDQLIIFPTTNSGYGIGKENAFCDENSELNPLSNYGKWKVEIEKMILNEANSISLRLATVFGMSPRMRIDLLVNNFVYKAITDKYLVLFEENFRRNYIHIKDVSNAFIHSINNRKSMINNSFNIGLTSANLTKKELALKIQSFVPDLQIISSEVGKDPDKRDYFVSNEKIENTGWKAYHSLDDGIQELIKGYKSINLHSNVNY